MKYNDTTSEVERHKVTQQVIAAIDTYVANLQTQIDDIKNSNAQNNIDEKIERYIKDHADVVVSTLENHFKTQTALEQKQAVAKGALQIVKDVNDGLLKTAIIRQNANITIIEFFDYACSFCEKMLLINEQILEQYKNASLIFIELPMLGAESIEATRISTAVSMFDNSKYLAFQNAIFHMKLPKNRDNLLQLAKDINIDIVGLSEYIDANIDSIEERIKQNSIAFNNMKLQGTPTYIINDEILVGAVSISEIKKIISNLQK